MEIVLSKILAQIHHQEDKLSSQMMPTADEAYQMTLFLKEMLCTIKAKVLQDSFADERQEIDFFRNIKPQILGKLIYYNKVFRIETTCSVSNGKIHQSFIVLRRTSPQKAGLSRLAVMVERSSHSSI